MCGGCKVTKELQGKGGRVWELQRSQWGSKNVAVLFPTELDCKRLEQGRRESVKNPKEKRDGGREWKGSQQGEANHSNNKSREQSKKEQVLYATGRGRRALGSLGFSYSTLAVCSRVLFSLLFT